MKASSSFLGTPLARMLREQYCRCRIDIPRVCNYPECVIEEDHTIRGARFVGTEPIKAKQRTGNSRGNNYFFAIEKTPEPMLKTNF